MFTHSHFHSHSHSRLETKTDVFSETAGSEAGGSQVGQLSDGLSALLSPAAGCPRGPTRVAATAGSLGCQSLNPPFDSFREG